MFLPLSQRFRFSLVLAALLGAVGCFWLLIRSADPEPDEAAVFWSLTEPTTAEELPRSQSVKILFGGDMQFDRWIRTVSRKQGMDFILAPLHELLTSVDLVVANLEGPITDHPSVSEMSAQGSHDNYVFTFPPETASLLKRENIGLVNIGNNHILNFKEEGVWQTKQFLDEAGAGYIGSPLAEDKRFVVRDIGGMRIAFVNYNQFVAQGKEKALADLIKVRGRADFTVVYTHWGREYEAATPEVKALAHEFVDAGADLIIGSHPHVVQEREIYQGKMIYYSLGNFIFDQYFRPETQAGLLVLATFDTAADHVTTEDIPIRLQTNGQTQRIAQ